MMIPTALAATLSINPNIPGLSNISTSGPAGWVKSFYTFALIISGILAFGAIVYGGIKYATSAGNAHNQQEGRDWIYSALIGLLLLAGAYLILKTINPNLVNLQNPSLSSVNNTNQTTNP
jgi:Type IV secretion system pilin